MHPPLSRAEADYYYREIYGIISNQSSLRSRFFMLIGALNEILKSATATELQFFSTSFARWEYVRDRYHVPNDAAIEIDKIRSLASALRRNRLECDDKHVDYAARIIARLILFFSGSAIPNELTKFLSATPQISVSGVADETAKRTEDDILDKSRRFYDESIPLFRCVASGKPKRIQHPYNATIIPVTDENGKQMRAVLGGRLIYLGDIVWNGAVLNLTNMKRSKRDASLLLSSADSLAILEPDILLDVTDIAECFQNSGANHKLYFLRRLKSQTATSALLLGSVANSFLDELLINPEAEFNVLLERAIRQKPLTTLAVMRADKNLYATLEASAKKHYDALRNITPQLAADIFYIEPTFISPRYGLQGRLDVLLEYSSDPLRKTIVELKSGSSPRPDVKSKLYDNQEPIPLGVWPNHYAQITAYNLLLDSVYDGRSGDSSVLYSADEVRPLRNAPNIPQFKIAVLNIRNRIVASENSLMNRKFGIYNEFDADKIGALPAFSRDESLEFSKIYNSLPIIDKQYFQAFTSFLIREQYTARAGADSGDRSGFAALWRDSLEEKRSRASVLTDLKLLPLESDADRLHLTFEREYSATSFRDGDPVTLYPVESNGDANPVNRQIIKATIKELTPERIKISVRNKQLGDFIFTLANDYSHWVVEADFIDSGFDHQHRALSAVLRASSAKRKMLLGLAPPRFAEKYDSVGTCLTNDTTSVPLICPNQDDEIKTPENSSFQNLEICYSNSELSDKVEANLLGIKCVKNTCTNYNEVENEYLKYSKASVEAMSDTQTTLSREQLNLAERALSARDYFLIQGPPGTGKTSVLLKSIVERLCRDANETVLLIAFTNRAVDEICASLKSVDKNFPFIRIGGKQQIEYEENMLWKIAESLSSEALAERFNATRFFAATAASALANPELFLIKKFTTLIADEASQLTEPALAGLCIEAERCILIGDEKQLPAVVAQEERGATVNSVELAKICLVDLRMSMFERLLRCCKRNGWSEGFGMLNRQARMHAEIERVVNHRFYGGGLSHINSWQESRDPSHANDGSVIGEISAAGRVVFVPSPSENSFKIHLEEARRATIIAASIANYHQNKFHSKTVGIITPFRAQIAEIIRALPQKLRDLVTIDTVERFQGGERDVIIISAAINFPTQIRAIQSLAEFDGELVDRKLNVALTRAKQQIILLGCEDALRESPVYAGLLNETPRIEWKWD